MTRRYAAGWLALALWSVGGGCGNPDAPPVSGSMEEVALTGTVRVRGKPVNNGIITFRTANVHRPTAPTYEAKIDKDGTYKITTLVGENFISVTSKEMFGPRNRDLIENEQMVKIESSQGTLDIDIPPKPPTEVLKAPE
jgi:hypothetical protein